MNGTYLRFQRVAFDENGQRITPAEVGVGDIHVYAFSLDIDETELARAARVLSSEERARGDRLVSELHRRRFMSAHAGLRVLLSRYCRDRPHDLVIHKTAKGKPFLADYPPIRFNLTHSHGNALVAVAKDRDVGIDLEKIRPEVDVMGLARRFLSDQDVAFIEDGDPAQSHERFLQAWTAREAVSKAIGTGMTFPLHGDHVELAGDGAEGYLILGDGDADGTYRLVRFLRLEFGWIGAVTAEGHNWSVVCCNVS